MLRAQIQFTEDQHRRLKAWADRLGVSVAEAVRRCVDDRLAREEPAGRAGLVRDALSVVGKYRDAGGSDVARNHDDVLDEAYGE